MKKKIGTYEDGCKRAEQYAADTVAFCAKDPDAYQGQCRALGYIHDKQTYYMNQGMNFQKGWKDTLKKIERQMERDMKALAK